MKKKKYYDYVFIIVVIVILVLPVLTFDRKSQISEKENRSLASLPYIFIDSKINFNYFKELEEYINDRFGFREQLISLNAKLKYDPAENWASISRALEGFNGWYFYSDDGNYESFLKNDLLTKEQLNRFDKKIENIEKFCKDNNIVTLYLICPNKFSVYEEYYPAERPSGITSTEQKLEILKENNATYLYPKDYLISLKDNYEQPLYYETDTHWNSLAAYNVSKIIREILIQKFPHSDFPIVKYNAEVYTSETFGDILPMLHIDNACSTQIDFYIADGKTYYEYLKNEDKNGVHTVSSNKTLPKALIFRDSFMIALEPFISPYFSEAEYTWKLIEDSDYDYILNFKPDILIIELVERSFTKNF